ncbi:MAG: [FeFe] hydrogenase H-cluster maturation GTPase HydF [Helicobacteraceae bacterium]|jgi:[FeFe] hydrogenase H-cluster maturation GTPase HydF|nr:[FeFe] hydrogenase H-cluster maturation GTPase HydF [Helicobacteraceae bacterium]
MSLNETPLANRVHIGIFGKRNAGKSSLINALSGQNVAIVSHTKGTTTDPVYKTMELSPLGPIALIDTPGIDDGGELGSLRVKRAMATLNKIDAAIVAIDAAIGLDETDRDLLRLLRSKDIPYVVAHNKSDLLDLPPQTDENAIAVSAKTGENIDALKAQIAALTKVGDPKLRIAGDLIGAGDFVVLVTPIDKSAPKGRLILPQQQTIRDVLEADAVAIVVKEFELRQTLASLGKKPALVVTDSQVFAKVAADVPRDIPLTSFSILFARYKGFLARSLEGAVAIDRIKDGDRILISEGCTHHRQCDDIGRVKLPRWIKSYANKRPEFDFTSGGEFPEDLSGYRLIVHCGGCMLNEREMRYRRGLAVDQGAAITNYGVLIAHMQGILKRSVAMFPHLAPLLERVDRE